MSRRVVAAFALLTFCALPPARAEHSAEHRHHLIAKAIGMALMHHGESAGEGGGSLAYEYEVFAHRLELELSAGLLRGAHATELPIELIVKTPFHLSDTFVPFIGLGPEILVELGHATYVGATATAGTSVWVSEHLGLVMSFDYTVFPHEGSNHELKGSLGVTWRI